MPRYAVTTFLNPKENELVTKIATKQGISKYKLLRKAVLSYCHDCLKEEKESDRETGGLEENSRGNSGNKTQTVETDRANGPPFIYT